MFRRGNFRSTFYDESKKQQQSRQKWVVVQLPLATKLVASRSPSPDSKEPKMARKRRRHGGKDNIFSRSRVIADISAHGFVFGEKPSTFL